MGLANDGVHEAIPLRELHSDADGEKSKHKGRKVGSDGVEHEREEIRDAKMIEKDTIVDKLWAFFKINYHKYFQLWWSVQSMIK